MSSKEPRSLGWWIDERRGELDLTLSDLAARAEVSTETLTKAAGGRPMRPTTRRRVERALQWEPGSITRILDGDEPTEDAALQVGREPDPREIARDMRDQLEHMKKQLDRLIELPSEPRRRSV